MLDITQINYDGKDLGVQDSVVMKAGNVVSTQLASLEYAPDFGSDLKYFLLSDFQIQNESFKSYLVQRLTNFQVNVTSVIELIDSLASNYTFYVDDANKQAKGLIA